MMLRSTRPTSSSLGRLFSTKEGRGVAASALSLALIHRSAWKGNSAKFAPRTCGWHHAPAGQASSKEDTFYEHLPHQDPSSYRRIQGGRVGWPNRSGPSQEDPLRVARGSRLWHCPRRT